MLRIPSDPAGAGRPSVGKMIKSLTYQVMSGDFYDRPGIGLMDFRDRFGDGKPPVFCRLDAPAGYGYAE